MVCHTRWALQGHPRKQQHPPAVATHTAAPGKAAVTGLRATTMPRAPSPPHGLKATHNQSRPDDPNKGNVRPRLTHTATSVLCTFLIHPVHHPNPPTTGKPSAKARFTTAPRP